MKRFLIAIAIGGFFSIWTFTDDIFFPNLVNYIPVTLDLLIRYIVYISCFVGILFILIAVVFLIAKRRTPKFLTNLTGFSMGVYLGLIFLIPVGDWDTNQRVTLGKKLSTEIENYLRKNGEYPKSLYLLNVENNGVLLSEKDQIGRFKYSYHTTEEGGYELIIFGRGLTSYHWDHNTKDSEPLIY